MYFILFQTGVYFCKCESVRKKVLLIRIILSLPPSAKLLLKWSALLRVTAFEISRFVVAVFEGKDRANVSKLVATQRLEAIRPNSLAQKAGLRRGDYVLAVCASRSLAVLLC